MPERVNGGVFNDQVLTGSLKHFRIVGANFQGAVGPTGQPISGSAAEIILTKIAQKATVVIMDPLSDPSGMSFALETNRADWSQEELQTMINSLGTIGVDQVNVSNVTVQQVPYNLIENNGSGGSTTFIGLTDTPNTYAGQGNRLVSVNATANGLTFITPPPAGATTFTALTDTPANYTGAANRYVTVNPGATGLQYTVLPTIPTNGSFTFVGLSDTANTVVPNGYLRWNAAGTEISYSSVIPASAIAGLATVATTGSYTDLSNTPDLSGFVETSDLATVATTGSYTDLSNTPAIPVNSDFSFVGLNDTPDSYVNSSGKYVVVNSAGDGLEFIAGQPPAVNNQVFFRHNGPVTQTISTAFSSLLFETSVENSTDVSYALGTITVESSGAYTISYQISTNATTAARTGTECKIQVDGTDVDGSLVYVYNRNTTDGRASSSATVRVQLNAGQTVVVQGRGTFTPVVTLPNACRLLITKDI
jgi:hypothetical protein